MHLAFDTAWLTAVLLCSLRLSTILMLTPVLQALGLPVRVRILIVLAFSVTLVSGPRGPMAAMPSDLPGLLAAGVNELLVGALMAYGIFAAFAAFSFAGNALDLQVGFNIASLFDPVTRSQSPLLASLLSMVAVALFFTMDAHHALLRGIGYSLERIPLGGPAPHPDAALLTRQFGIVFTLGLMLAAPILFCLFLVELALAVLSRNLQQMNVFVLGAPIKIAVGLTLMAVMAAHIGSVARRIFDSIFTFWEAVL
jgi:flagellar biosynthetic protein FliR